MHLYRCNINLKRKKLMQIKIQDTSTYKTVFWSNLICTIFFNVFGLLTILNTQYSNKYKNKLQLLGSLLGILPSFILYLSIATFLIFNNYLKFFIPITLIILIIIYVLIIKKISKKKGL